MLWLFTSHLGKSSRLTGYFMQKINEYWRTSSMVERGLCRRNRECGKEADEEMRYHHVETVCLLHSL